MKMTGAGISTLLSRLICPVAIFVIFMKVKRYKRYHGGFIHPERRPGLAKKIFRTSFPVSLQLGLETGSFAIAALMSGWLGHLQLASFQIIVIVGSLGFCVYYSMANAVSVLVANAKGRDDKLAMRRVAFAGYHVILFLAAIASLTFFFFGRQLVGVFTEDPEVIALTMTLILPLILYQLCDATQITFSNALRGTSNVVPMMWIAIVAYLVVGVPLTYLFGFTLSMGLWGIVLNFSVSLFIAAASFLYFFLRTTRLTCS